MARAIDLAKVIYQAPDLVLMERFLTDFGLTTVERDGQRLLMRGAGAQHHCHETRLGEARFVGAVFEVEDRADLDELASRSGSSAVEPTGEPGGGWHVRLAVPDGFEFRAVWGRERAPMADVRAPHAFNAGAVKPRVNGPIRVATEPGSALRLGHFVVKTTDHDAMVAWLCDAFGTLASDYFLPPGADGPVVGTFLRFDRGTTLVDHHSLLVLQAQDGRPDVHHCSFEVQDLDAIMCAHDYLAEQGWRLDCGVGRHLLGSQVFDYWRDPFGFRVEHYTDGDVVDASHAPTRFNGTAAETTQWGMEPPPEFFQ